MSRRYVLRADRTRCDANWMLDGLHEIRGLTLADLLLVLVIVSATGIPYRVSIDRDTREEQAA